MRNNNNHKLPNEILIKIFRYLPNKDVEKCQLVCKSWNFPAKEEFYKDINIKGHQCSRKLLSSLEKTDYGFYIKHITITRAEGESLYRRLPPLALKKTSTSLLQCCPNLVTICLGELNPFYMLLTLKNHAKNNVQLEKLSKISISNDVYQSPSVQHQYQLANLSFASTITSLDLLNSRVNIKWLDKHHGGFPNYISQFPNLEHLSIRSISKRVSFSILPGGLPAILSCISNLKKLTFYGNGLNIEVYDVSATKNYNSLKELELDIVQLAINDIKYIVATFPNLEKLHVYSIIETSWPPNSEEKSEVVESYKKYSTRLKETNIIIDDLI